MNPSDIFFIIASVGLVVIWSFVIAILFYIWRAFHVFHGILQKVEKNLDSVGDVTRELLVDMQGSKVYKFLFAKKNANK